MVETEMFVMALPRKFRIFREDLTVLAHFFLQKWTKIIYGLLGE
jgi:hypothetical protein